MDSAEVVIVGGGAMGTSIAHHLAAAGVTDVLLLEANELGSGSSGKPLGGVRAQFSSEPNIRLGARGLAAYGRFAHELGTDIGLRRCGYLFALRTREAVADFEASVDLQNSLGVPSRMITPGEALALNPYLDADGILAAAWSPDDGFAHPGAVVRGYAAAAARRGVRIHPHTEVTGLERTATGGWVVHHKSPMGDDVSLARALVCAAGAWSGWIGELAGVRLPVQPVRRQIVFTPPLSPAPAAIPFTIDYDSTFYAHNGTGTDLLVGIAEADQPPGFALDYDEGWLPGLRAAAVRCLPGLAGVLAEGPLERGWAGLYEVTPDHNALIGAEGSFYYCAGFSGHGFLQAPAAGEIVRDLYLGAEPFCDVAAFDAARFGASAAGFEELNIV